MLKPWGCANTPPADGYWAKDGMVLEDRMDGEKVAFYRMTWVQNRMSRECRYDKRDEDWRCRGCTRERMSTGQDKTDST